MTSSSSLIEIPRVELVGHLSEDSLRRSLVLLRLPVERGPVLFDCRRMTGYELAARHAFVEWHRANTKRVSRVAIVTDNRVWWMVIGAMSLASGHAMQGFESVEEAIRWARLG